MNPRDKIAIKFITKIMQEIYGYDFSNYSQASFIRRLTYHMQKKKLSSLAEMIPGLINESHAFDELLSDLSITVTEMFRNPEFYKTFAKIVIPKIKTYPFSKIWHAGCATGEEVYSMAILLHENSHLKRTQLYATDFNPYAINSAKRGIYPKDRYLLYEENYHSVNPNGDFKQYFSEKYDALKVRRFLQERVAFSVHNLVTDNVFSEVEVIVCRNVLIYFDNKLRNRALDLFYESLSPYGFLCLGNKESLDTEKFRCINKAQSIYQKVP